MHRPKSAEAYWAQDVYSSQTQATRESGQKRLRSARAAGGNAGTTPVAY
jgi:hypothetical protein